MLHKQVEDTLYVVINTLWTTWGYTTWWSMLHKQAEATLRGGQCCINKLRIHYVHGDQCCINKLRIHYVHGDQCCMNKLRIHYVHGDQCCMNKLRIHYVHGDQRCMNKLRLHLKPVYLLFLSHISTALSAHDYSSAHVPLNQRLVDSKEYLWGHFYTIIPRYMLPSVYLIHLFSRHWTTVSLSVGDLPEHYETAAPTEGTLLPCQPRTLPVC